LKNCHLSIPASPSVQPVGPRDNPAAHVAFLPSPQFIRHAEEVIGNEFVSAVKSLKITSEQLVGKTLSIHISHPKRVCRTCAQNLSDKSKPHVKPGVLKQLSQRFPGLTIRITAQDANAYFSKPVLVLRDGKIVE
jgi:hypothetical protein